MIESLEDEENCPIANPIDFEFLLLLERFNTQKERYEIPVTCDQFHSPSTKALGEVIKFPELSLDSFKLIMKKYRMDNLKYDQNYKELLKDKLNRKIEYPIEKLLTFKSGNHYKSYQEYIQSDYYKKANIYLRYVTEVLIAIEIKNYLRAENYIEKLINLNPLRLMFDVNFNSKVQEIFQKIIRIIDIKSIESKKTAMFFDLLKDHFEVPETEPVFDSLQELRFQFKSFLGRNFPFYYLRMIKKQISQKETLAYSNLVLANLEGKKDVPVEVWFELLEKLPRNKEVMKMITLSLKDFEEMSLFESFLVLKASENEVFRRFLVDNLKNTPKAKFQLERKIYLKLLRHPKLTLFALSKLWSMGDKNTELLWDSVLILN